MLSLFGLRPFIRWSYILDCLYLQDLVSLGVPLHILVTHGYFIVMYDTQMIVERASAGSMDIPGHAIELFMDLFSLFIRLANILLKKQMEREGNERKKRRREDRGDIRRSYY